MKALYLEYLGWRIHHSDTSGYFAWNMRRGWDRSRLLRARTQREIKQKIHELERGRDGGK